MDGLVLNLERSNLRSCVFLTYLLRLHNYLIVQCAMQRKHGECVIMGGNVRLLGLCGGLKQGCDLAR